MHDLELGYLTADPPKDGSATTFKAEALRPQRKTFLVRKYSDLCGLGVSVVNTLSQ
jgi:hypothetical protein